ncbi:MAG: hypothetical protein ABIT38_11705 [Gemmatimonadaceae bacterium]
MSGRLVLRVGSIRSGRLHRSDRCNLCGGAMAKEVDHLTRIAARDRESNTVAQLDL